MWIEEIRLTNYRQYQEEKIKLSDPNAKKNICVIEGANGAGKTNIMNAITWCLYGKELHLTNKKYEGYPVYNLLASRRAKPGDNIIVEVELALNDVGSDKANIKRTLTYRKEVDGTMRQIPGIEKDGSDLSMMRLIRKNWIDCPQPQFVIDKMIPDTIQEYFFFDGERLELYFRDTSSKNIKGAVEKISQVGLLQKLIDHLDKVSDDIVKTHKGLSPKVQELQDLISTKKASLQSYIDETKIKKDDMAEAARKETEYSEKLQNCKVQNISQLDAERAALEDDITRLEKALIEAEDKEFQYLIKVGPAILIEDAIDQYLKLIDIAKSSGQLPPEYRKSFIENLLKNKMCICGTTLNEGSNERKAVEEYVNKMTAVSDLEREILVDCGTLGQIEDERNDIESTIKTNVNVISRINEDIKKKSERIAQIDQLVASCNKDEIKRWEAALQEYKQLKTNLLSEVSQRDVRIDLTSKDIEKNVKDLQAELAKEKKASELLIKKEFCEECIKVAKKVKDEIVEEVRRDIEVKTSSQFLDIIWKKNTYSRVLIDDNYNIFVKDIAGDDALGSLSAGETLILALSFVAALNEVSGFNIPIVIDAPLGKISRIPKIQCAKLLPLIFPNRQVTLLLTEEELTQDVRNELKPHMGKEYSIRFKEYPDGAESKVMLI